MVMLSFQVMVILLIQEPHFESHWPRKPSLVIMYTGSTWSRVILSSRTLLLQGCPCTNTDGITWRYVRNAESQVPCQICCIRICIFNKFSQWVICTWKLEKHCCRRFWWLVEKLLEEEYRSHNLEEYFGLTAKAQQGNRNLYRSIVVKKQPWIVVTRLIQEVTSWVGSGGKSSDLTARRCWPQIISLSCLLYKNCSWLRVVILGFGCH